MLKLTLFEFIFRGIPETFIVMLSLFALSNTKLEIRKYIISSVLLSIGEYCIRMLPINYGVHTILGIFLMILIMSCMNNTDITLAIKATLISTIVLYILEAIDVLISSLILKNEIEFIMNNSHYKVVVGMPSLFLFLLITIIFYQKRKGV